MIHIHSSICFLLPDLPVCALASHPPLVDGLSALLFGNLINYIVGLGTQSLGFSKYEFLNSFKAELDLYNWQKEK